MRRHPSIEVKDFGPIASGKVELRPLTVFAGPSNTGKSWFATLLYAMKYLKTGAAERILKGATAMTLLEVVGLSRFPENPAAWIESIKKGRPVKLTNAERALLKLMVEQRIVIFEDEIQRCFGLSSFEDLVRNGSTGGAVVKSRPLTDEARFQYSYELSFKKECSYSIEPPKEIDLSLDPSPLFQLTKADSLDVLREISESKDEDWHIPKGTDRAAAYLEPPVVFQQADWLLALILDLSLNERSSTWYLPADRGGVMHAHHAVVSSTIQSASRTALLRQQPIPTLSGVLADFLDNLILLAQRPVFLRGRDGGDLVKKLERNIIGGQVKVEASQANYPRFLWQPTGWKKSLSLMNASSMVSELAPVALYLNHLVRKGDTLILEEPEAHLHPAMQVDLMQEIAGWVRSGIRVVLTTHSEWVLEAMSNLVAEGLRDESAGLDGDDVGLWMFKKGKNGGSRIKEVKWDVDKGGYEADFYKVSVDVHNRWADLVEGME